MLNRRMALAAALGLYVAVFLSFIFVEVPGLGLGHFFYVPVALIDGQGQRAEEGGASA